MEHFVFFEIFYLKKESQWVILYLGVEEQNMQVSYIGSTLASQAGRVGSTPITCSDMKLK